MSDPTDGALGESSGGPIAVTSSAGGFPAGNGARTVELWVQASCSPCGAAQVFAYGGSDAFSITLNPGGDNYGVQVADGSNQVSLHTQVDLINGGWHLLDVAYNGSGALVYVDGQPQGSAPLQAATVVANSNMGLGSNNNIDFNYDELAVYPTALGGRQRR